MASELGALRGAAFLWGRGSEILLLSRRAGAHAVLIRADDERHSHDLRLIGYQSCHALAPCGCVDQSVRVAAADHGELAYLVDLRPPFVLVGVVELKAANRMAIDEEVDVEPVTDIRSNLLRDGHSLSSGFQRDERVVRGCLPRTVPNDQ